MAVLSNVAPDRTPRRAAWDPALAFERKGLLKMMLINLALVTAACWAILGLYFGTYFRQEENAYRLTVRILDMDSQYAKQVASAPPAILGPAVVEAAKRDIATMPHYHLGWQFASDAELQQLRIQEGGQGLNASDYARNLVLDQDVFGVILINSNATVLATEAAQQGNAAYDPRGAISFYYEEARNFYSENQYVAFLGLQLIESAIATASAEFVSQILTNAAPAGNVGGAGNVTALSTALEGNALSWPFYYSTFNLRPFDQLAGEAATTAGQIYLIIFTFFSSPIWKKSFEPLRRKLSMSSMLFLHWAVPVACYFWISLNYSLVTLAFHVNFTRKYGYGGFPLFWAMNWTSMTALGLVMETMLRIAGPLFFPFFLMFWVIWNVSTAFLDLSDMDRFYLYGFAFPVWNSIDTAKSIIFGTKFHLTQNFLVNLSWIIGGTIALLSLCAYQRKKEDREDREKKIKEIEEKRNAKT